MFRGCAVRRFSSMVGHQNCNNYKKFSNTKFNCIFSCLLTFIVIYLSVLYHICVNSNTRLLFGNRRAVELKKILFWNSLFHKEDFGFGFGRRAFLDNKCEYNNCYITNDDKLTALENFDAVIIHGPTFNSFRPDYRGYPPSRSFHQCYVYYSIEPPQLFPLSNMFDNNFNLTISYRMDSDIPEYYFEMKDLLGNIVSPGWHPPWRKATIVNESLQLQHGIDIYKRKSKPAAWIVSKCTTLNRRLEYVNELKTHINVDVYGACGTEKCSTDKECFNLLKKDYYFYLAFENSNCVDYVTEKIYNAINNDCIPIVFNGADMTKFLPPHSYINAIRMAPQKLAKMMNYLIKNPKEYAKYFWWKQYYKPSYSVMVHPFCRLCEYLHDPSRKPKTYKMLTRWAHGSPGNPLCF